MISLLCILSLVGMGAVGWLVAAIAMLGDS